MPGPPAPTAKNSNVVIGVTLVIILLLELLAELVPILFVAVTVNV
jgi:hypothetical protein